MPLRISSEAHGFSEGMSVYVLKNDVDWGDRIKASKLGLLFEKFEQCSTSTTSTYGGTGLGLAVSKRLVMKLPSKNSFRRVLKPDVCFLTK
jgi:signal transduction histidine kinase